jgi:uncharacterized protein YbdZ (MbtH family)
MFFFKNNLEKKKLGVVGPGKPNHSTWPFFCSIPGGQHVLSLDFFKQKKSNNVSSNFLIIMLLL